MLPPPMTIANLDVEVDDPLDLARDGLGDGRVDAEGRLAHQRFAAQLEQGPGRTSPPRRQLPFARPRRPASPGFRRRLLVELVGRGRSAPTSKRAKRRTTMFSPSLPMAAWTRSRIVRFGSLMKGWSSRQTASSASLAVAELALELGPGLVRDLVLGDVARVHGRDLHRDVVGEGLEVRRAGDEVGLAVDLDQRADAAAGVDVGLDRRPGAAARPAFFSALARPCWRRTSTALSTSPPASSSARLHSMMPAPVCLPELLDLRCADDHGYSSVVLSRRCRSDERSTSLASATERRSRVGYDSAPRPSARGSATAARRRRVRLVLGGLRRRAADDPSSRSAWRSPGASSPAIAASAMPAVIRRTERIASSLAGMTKSIVVRVAVGVGDRDDRDLEAARLVDRRGARAWDRR